jgi:hypothetical protein
MPPGLDLNVVVERLARALVLVAVVLGVSWAVRSPVGAAIGGWIRTGRRGRRGLGGLGGPGGAWLEGPGEGTGNDTRVPTLEERVQLLGTQVSELGERLDFAERLLAERRERRLDAGQ